MSNLEIYNNAFMEVFSIDSSDLESLVYQGISAWDSVGHMNLITTIESAFEIMMDTDDIIDFNSYKIGKSILGKYDVTVM